MGVLTQSKKRVNFDGHIPNLLSLLCNANAACERFKSAYVTKHFKNCIKEILEKYENSQKRFIKEFLFSKVVGWRLAVLLIMFFFLFIFQGIWFNFKFVLIAVTASNHSFTRSMFFTNVKLPTITCRSLSTLST